MSFEERFGIKHHSPSDVADHMRGEDPDFNRCFILTCKPGYEKNKKRRGLTPWHPEVQVRIKEVEEGIRRMLDITCTQFLNKACHLDSTPCEQAAFPDTEVFWDPPFCRDGECQ